MTKPGIRPITRALWNALHDDYKSWIDGKPHVLVLDDEQRTILEPVEIIEPLTERDYDVVRIGPYFQIRGPSGIVRAGLPSRIVRFKSADDAFTYIRERLVDKEQK